MNVISRTSVSSVRRAHTQAFTTRLAKMADAQVCSAKRRGDFKSTYLHFNKPFTHLELSICHYSVLIFVPESLQTTFTRL